MHPRRIVLNIQRSGISAAWRVYTLKGTLPFNRARPYTHTHIHTQWMHTPDVHVRAVCILKTALRSVPASARENNSGDYRSEKKASLLPPHTHKHTHTTLSPDLWRKATDGPFFFGQVPADSCPGYREVRWCLYVLGLGGWGGCRRETVRGQTFPGWKNWSASEMIC